MPRPRKCRKVCYMPRCVRFVPAGIEDVKYVTLTVDEYEAVRLIDRAGLSQEECALRMQVARTTVQQIYSNARFKIAAAITEGAGLKIEGGDYRLCDAVSEFCGYPGCGRRRYLNAGGYGGRYVRQVPSESLEAGLKPVPAGPTEAGLKYENKENGVMKAVIPVDENGNVCAVFARAPKFAVRDYDGGEIRYVENPACNAQGGAGLKAAQAVIDTGASCLITYRLGENAAQILNVASVAVYKAVSNTAEENFRLLSEKKLEPLTYFHSGYHGLR